MPRPAMSGAEPWTGSNIDGKMPFGIDVRRWRDRDRAGQAGAEIGQDVAEQVRRDHDIEPFGIGDEARGEDVDMILIDCRDLGIARRRIAANRSSQNGIE